MEQKKHLELRWGVRQPVRAAVTLYVAGQRPWLARCRDVSIGGLFVETDPSRLALDGAVIVSFALMSEEGRTHPRLPARVVRLGPDGAGLMFSDFKPETLHVLRALCALHDMNPTALLARTRNRPRRLGARI